MGFIPGMERWFNIGKSTIMIKYMHYYSLNINKCYGGSDTKGLVAR
jgi:hypothetical protein